MAGAVNDAESSMNSCPLTEQNVLKASKTSEAPSSNPVTCGLSRSRQ